ncbi:hypothetical protein MCAP1_002162 [Malassezia caprae]|uniref:HIT-type domain-containing protein n=1 Tax=Malassezia caprae TaxID=1381934 RepID=A0AAF0E6X6_9BASI|nr:hypothetical protein MCAP1_002162 [Malassezia caprae]
MAAAHGRALPLRSRTRAPPARAAAADAAERAARSERASILAQHRRHRRLLELGATCFPADRTRPTPGGGTAEQTITAVMRQSANEAQAPPVAAEKQLHRTSAGVRRLLAARRGANALLDEAATLGHLARMPSFLLGAPRCAARPLCSVCGYWGDVSCMACGEPCCSRVCVATHRETRCERPIG